MAMMVILSNCNRERERYRQFTIMRKPKKATATAAAEEFPALVAESVE
jgi:hypothetical protein